MASEQQTTTGPAPVPATGRTCGTCMMCCKVLHIEALGKPMGKWCSHAVSGRGCGIYESRPDACRAFLCEWLTNPALSPEWKPEKSKFVLYGTPEGNLCLVVDPAHPRAWREERFYPQLKLAAAQLAERGRMLSVYVGNRVTIVLPEQNVEAGFVPDGHAVSLRHTLVEGRPHYEAVVEPRVARQG